MTLFTHSGTAAIDLSAARPEKAPEPWKPTPIPDITKLEHTAKGWIFQNGVHRPPPDLAEIYQRQLQSLTTHNHIIQNAYLTPYSTSVAFSPFLSGFGYTATPPKALPVEKREMPVIGYRAWEFSPTWKLGWGKRGTLNSLNSQFGAWAKGNNQASCSPGGHNHSFAEAHEVPGEYCQCGFYVLADLDQVMSHVQMTDDILIGAVMGWGKVVQHGIEGWRAGNARIIALLDCKYSKVQSENTRAAAREYGLEVKERPALEMLVGEWGDPFVAK